MVRFGDDDPARTGGVAARGVEHLQLVEPLQVERDRPAVAVHLEGEAVLAAGGHPADLDARHHTVRGLQRRPRGVVDGDRLRAVGPRSGRHERPQVAGRRHHGLAEQVLHLVDDVRAEIAEHAGTGGLLAQPPGHRHSRIGQPVLEVRRPHLPHGADPALRHQPSGELERRHPPVVEADHRPLAALARGVGRGHHLLGLGDAVGHRLLDQHVLACFERGERDLAVGVAGRADVDHVDVVAGDRGAPVGLGIGPAEPGRGRLHRNGVPPDDHLLPDTCRVREERAHVAPGVGVGLAHEGVADDGDAEGLVLRSRGTRRLEGLVGHRVPPVGAPAWTERRNARPSRARSSGEGRAVARSTRPRRWRRCRG